MPTLSDLYNADKRATDPDIAYLAARECIPHPLSNTTYADGTTGCYIGNRAEPFDAPDTEPHAADEALRVLRRRAERGLS